LLLLQLLVSFCHRCERRSGNVSDMTEPAVSASLLGRNTSVGAGFSVSSGALVPMGSPAGAGGLDSHDPPMVVEVFSVSARAWFVALVVGTSEDRLRLRFIDAEGTRREKVAIRGEGQLAHFGTNFGDVLPPGVTAVPSNTRPGQLAYMDSTVNRKFATPAFAWQAYLERHLVGIQSSSGVSASGSVSGQQPPSRIHGGHPLHPGSLPHGSGGSAGALVAQTPSTFKQPARKVVAALVAAKQKSLATAAQKKAIPQYPWESGLKAGRPNSAAVSPAQQLPAPSLVAAGAGSPAPLPASSPRAVAEAAVAVSAAAPPAQQPAQVLLAPKPLAPVAAIATATAKATAKYAVAMTAAQLASVAAATVGSAPRVEEVKLSMCSSNEPAVVGSGDASFRPPARLLPVATLGEMPADIDVAAIRDVCDKSSACGPPEDNDDYAGVHTPITSHVAATALLHEHDREPQLPVSGSGGAEQPAWRTDGCLPPAASGEGLRSEPLAWPTSSCDGRGGEAFADGIQPAVPVSDTPSEPLSLQADSDDGGGVLQLPTDEAFPESADAGDAGAALGFTAPRSGCASTAAADRQRNIGSVGTGALSASAEGDEETNPVRRRLLHIRKSLLQVGGPRAKDSADGRRNIGSVGAGALSVTAEADEETHPVRRRLLQIRKSLLQLGGQHTK